MIIGFEELLPLCIYIPLAACFIPCLSLILLFVSVETHQFNHIFEIHCDIHMEMIWKWHTVTSAAVEYEK